MNAVILILIYLILFNAWPSTNFRCHFRERTSFLVTFVCIDFNFRMAYNVCRYGEGWRWQICHQMARNDEIQAMKIHRIYRRWWMAHCGIESDPSTHWDCHEMFAQMFERRATTKAYINLNPSNIICSVFRYLDQTKNSIVTILYGYYYLKFWFFFCLIFFCLV